MNVLVDLCIVPLGVGVSLSPYVAACQKVLAEAGLKSTRTDRAQTMEEKVHSVREKLGNGKG
jgi:uncharacterized protein YqgV (UPF0045/DUF77 family)